MLHGDEFIDALDVYFYSGGAGLQKAGFRAFSDHEIEVQVPQGCRYGKQLIVIVNSQGATVTEPADFVARYGKNTPHESALSARRLRRPGEPRKGSVVTSKDAYPLNWIGQGLVEEVKHGDFFYLDDGAILATRRPVPVCMVKRGGRAPTLHGVSAIFYEPGAAVPETAKRGRMSLEVASIRPSPMSLAFCVVPEWEAQIARATTPPARRQPAQQAEAVPRIKSISPARVKPGGKATLRGRGFTGASDVFLVKPNNQTSAVQFQVIADGELRIEVPKHCRGEQLVVVVNSRGLTVTKPASRRMAQSSLDRSLFDMIVGGDVVRHKTDGCVYFIEPRGSLARFGGNCTLFVKNGGRIGDEGGDGIVFYEPEVAIPAGLAENPKNAFLQVQEIVPSKIVRPLFVE